MRQTVEIFLGDEPRLVGVLRYNAEGARESAVFEYHPSWLAASNRFSIDPALPLVSGAQFHKRTVDGSIFHGVIADTEPDGWGRRVILRDHVKRMQESRQSGATTDSRALNGLDFLLEVDDESRVGALRFRDEGVFRRAPLPGRRTVPPLVELGDLRATTELRRKSSSTFSMRSLDPA